MTYNFINQSDESLENLSTAVFLERERRIAAQIDKWPKPFLVYDEEENFMLIQSIKEYRALHHCSLLQARTVVKYYAEK